MESFKYLHKLMALPLITMLILSTFMMSTAQAKMIGTDQIIHEETVQADRTKVKAFMQRDDVRAEMQSLGVNPDEAMSRVQTMSDQEVQRVAGHIDQMPAGGAIGAIVGAVVFVFVVLLLTDILCLTDVFDFTRCAR